MDIVQREQKLQHIMSDFSIARILADDRKSDEEEKLKETEIHRSQRETSKNEEDVKDTKLRDLEIEERQRNSLASCSISFEEPISSISHASLTTGFHRLPPSSPSSASSSYSSSNPQRNELTWLQYTRYKPPKLPRKCFIGKNTKRRPGVHPRIPFSSVQLQVLEDRYKKNAYLSRTDVLDISTSLRLPQSRVKIWFQNRRAKDKRESQNSIAIV